jgi:sugar transferase EpsL
MSLYTHLFKKWLDLALVSLTLVLLMPILGVLAWLVNSKLGSPVLFRQVRPGLDGLPFTILKFRTMTGDRDGTGQLLSDEERLTPFGRWLRRTSLDELPSLINVLKGDMSLVGPRPLLMEYSNRYSPEQARRHQVRPGMTGWAQVKGRNDLDWERKFELDVWYVDHVSLLLDLRILALTGWKVVTGQGVSAKGHATMPVFEGTDRHEE